MDEEMSDYIDKLEVLNDKKKSFNDGAMQTKKDMVINFYNSGVSIDIISSASGLSKDQVEEIIKANKKS